jgi:hypothetical protein
MSTIRAGTFRYCQRYNPEESANLAENIVLQSTHHLSVGARFRKWRPEEF